MFDFSIDKQMFAQYNIKYRTAVCMNKRSIQGILVYNLIHVVKRINMNIDFN